MSEAGSAGSQESDTDIAILQTKYDQATTLLRQGNLADADRICKEILRQQSNHFGALYLLGLIAFQTLQTERAIELIGSAIALKPDFAEAHNSRGNALLHLQRPEDALASYDRAITLKPDFAQAYSNRASALMILKRPEDAVTSCEQAIRLNRDIPEGWHNLAGSLIVLCRWKEAEEACRKAVNLKPDFAPAWINLGHALSELERWDEAVVACRRAVTLKPDDFSAWNSLGHAFIALGCWNEAEEACRKAAALKPDNSFAWTYLSRALSAQKRSIEAAEAMHRAMALTPISKDVRDMKEANLRALHEAVNRLVAEAKNNGAAFALRAESICALHRIAMHGLLPNPGEYRKRSIGIGSSPRVPPNWRDVPALMEDMCRYVNANWTLRDAIHLGALVLWRLNWIHPFGDGNGRIARAVCNSILYIKTASPIPATKSFVEALVEDRTVYAEYIACLIDAHDAYSQSQNLEQATPHVEQWLSHYWE